MRLRAIGEVVSLVVAMGLGSPGVSTCPLYIHLTASRNTRSALEGQPATLSIMHTYLLMVSRNAERAQVGARKRQREAGGPEQQQQQ